MNQSLDHSQNQVLTTTQNPSSDSSLPHTSSLPQPNPKKRKKITILISLTVILLILVVSVVSFLAWRIRSINKTTQVYTANHAIVINISADYSSLAQEFQKNESQLYESDFSATQQQSTLLGASSKQAKDSLISSDEGIIKQQVTLARPLLNSITVLTSQIDEYITYVDCISSIETKIQTLDKQISDTPLVDSSSAKPQTEGITKVRDYLRQQSDLYLDFVKCYVADAALDVVADSQNTTVLITTYSESLLSLSNTITTLLEFINLQNSQQAFEVSTQIVAEQAKLYEISPEKNIFVTSPQIQNHINEINIQIEQYNANHSRILRLR